MEETTWTSPILEDEDNYYYYATKECIRRVRKDSLDYGIIYYNPEESINENIDPENLTVYNDYVYFVQYDYDYDSNNNKIYDIQINKISKTGDSEVKNLLDKKVGLGSILDIEMTTTSKAFYYIIDGKMYKFDLEKESEEVFAEDEILSGNFAINDDESIYLCKSGKLYQIVNGEVKVIFDDFSEIEYDFVKQGDYLYFSASTLGFDDDNLRYVNLKNGNIEEIESDKKGLVFNYGNSIYLYGKDNNIYKLNNKKWEEYAKLNDFKTRSMGDDVRLTSDAVILITDAGKITYVYNFKENLYYQEGEVNESLANKDTYLVNKMKSTKLLEDNSRQSKDGSVIYTTNSENSIIRGDIGDSLFYKKSDLTVFCSTAEMEEALKLGTVEKIAEPDINNGYCYWVVSTYDKEAIDNRYAIALLRKKCDGTAPVEVINTFKNENLNTTYYAEGRMLIVTSSSIYVVNYNSKPEMSLLYTVMVGGKKRTFASYDIGGGNDESFHYYVQFLDKEILIKDPNNGRLYVSAYDGSYTKLELFDRAYGNSISMAKRDGVVVHANFKIEDGYLVFETKKLNLNTGKFEDVKAE